MEVPDFDSWVAARGPALLRLAYVLTGNGADAEDVVQDALSRALPGWSRISTVDDPDAYVRRMVVNAHVSRWRKFRRREVPVEAVHDSAARRRGARNRTGCGGRAGRCPRTSGPPSCCGSTKTWTMPRSPPSPACARAACARAFPRGGGCDTSGRRMSDFEIAAARHPRRACLPAPAPRARRRGAAPAAATSYEWGSWPRRRRRRGGAARPQPASGSRATAADRTADEPTATSGLPPGVIETGYRAESWHDVTFEVPVDWGYGGCLRCAPVAGLDGRGRVVDRPDTSCRPSRAPRGTATA